MKYVFGNKRYFELQYGNTDKVIEMFDKEFQDVSSSMFGENKYTPSEIVYYNAISMQRSGRTVTPFLETNLFLAKCYEKRVKKFLSKNTYDKASLDKILTEISEMMKCTTHHIEEDTKYNRQ